MSDNVVPLSLSGPSALRLVRQLAAVSGNIVVIAHAAKRQKERNITRRQIEFCVQTGFIAEAPFLNTHGNWQLTMCCVHAGDELTCVVAIDWPNKLIIITAY